jgi:hypothetical protein
MQTRKRRAPAATTKSKYVLVKATGKHTDRIDRRPSKRRKKNESDDEDVEQGDDDDEASSVAEGPAATSDDDMSEDGGSGTEDSSKAPKLGRGARGRAKVSVQPTTVALSLNASLRKRLGRRERRERNKMIKMLVL